MSYMTWIQDQIAKPMSSHREYYRKMVNARLTSSTTIGVTKAACRRGSRWTRFAFIKSDVGKQVTYTFDHKLKVDGVVVTEVDTDYSQNALAAPVACTNTRTSGTCMGLQAWMCISSTWWVEEGFCRKGCYAQGIGYEGDVCTDGWPSLHVDNSDVVYEICGVKEEVGGWMLIAAAGACTAALKDASKGGIAMQNPAIYFETPPETIDTRGVPFQTNTTVGEGVIFLKEEQEADCVLNGKMLVNIDGLMYREDPRLELLANPLESPNAAVDESVCPVVGRHPLNEDYCVVSPTCQPSSSYTGTIQLTTSNILALKTFTGRYVYSIANLPVSDSPCEGSSRWQLCDTDCGSEAVADDDVADLVELLQAAEDQGDLRDITSRSCSSSKVSAGSYIVVGDQTFRNVHANEGNVYDFTAWVDAHPGGSGPITQEAWVSTGQLQFPSWHPVSRWNLQSTQSHLDYLGKLGEEVSFEDFPTALQSSELAANFSLEETSGGWLACGSIGEVANDPMLGHRFAMYTNFSGETEEVDVKLDDFFGMNKDYMPKYSKTSVWFMKALGADDQLRQRMAWALSQIWVAAADTTDMNHMSEIWTTYYDIFVRNGLGNYRDIMREVTYSPVMGSYLSYTKNSAYDYDKFHPDENYARELLQLFSIGLWQLDEDGARLQDDEGNDIATYNNTHIVSNARVMTGLAEQSVRANIESFRTYNKIDPMQMTAAMHDVYPKIDIYDGYLGDGYTLCTDLPTQGFLREGAEYEFIGCSYSETDVLVLNSSSSSLFEALASLSGSEDTASCPGTITKLKVTLSSDVPCTAEECLAVNPTVVQVGSNFFKYLRPICVNLYFYSGRITSEIGTKWTWTNIRRCDNPRARVAGTWCCKGCRDTPGWVWDETCAEKYDRIGNTMGNYCNKKTTWIDYKLCEYTCARIGYPFDWTNCTDGAYKEEFRCAYPAEYLTYEEASARCASTTASSSGESLEICEEDEPELESAEDLESPCGADADGAARVWTSESCTWDVRVSHTGEVASLRDSKTSVNFFRVVWESATHPNVGSCALHGCEETTNGDACDCAMSIEESILFSEPPSEAEVLQALRRMKVGARTDQVGHYDSVTRCGTDCSVFWNASSKADSIIRYEGTLYKNWASTVLLGDGSVSFRNPPAFMLAELVDERQAYAEIEALIDMAFHHPNTPVFVAKQLIQRLVSSNPSAGYLRNASKAFRTGEYEGMVFSGQRGDLAATAAAILLDPEARGGVGETYVGALREPLIKAVHFFRAMQYEDKQSPPRQFTLLESIDGIGQWPYDSPTVFNFYKPDYQPRRFEGSLVGPEFQIFTTPTIVGFLNGMLSFLDYGVSGCYGGFGFANRPCEQGAFSWKPSDGGGDIELLVDELDLLLTGGRLNASRSVVISAATEAGADEAAQTLAAQQAMLLTPEFHTLGANAGAGDRANESETVLPDPTDYKALVFLYMNGGADTFNLLVPQNANCALYDEYVSVREDVALAENELLTFDVSGQACSQFAVHGSMPFLHRLVATEKTAAFITNVGSLVTPTTKSAYENNEVERCAGLFSHSDQTNAAMTLKCQVQGASPKGFGGRMVDVLTEAGLTTTSFSIAGSNTFTEGFNTSAQMIDKTSGAVTLNKYTDLESLIAALSKQAHENIYCEEYALRLKEAMEESHDLAEIFASDELQSIDNSGDFPDTLVGNQLKQVAKLIKSRTDRKASRDIFYVQLGGFDTHSDVAEVLATKFEQIDDALEAFVTELQDQGNYDKVALTSTSDFGRTLTSNGAGTDHAWAGNHFVLGGAINGGNVFNQFPESLLEGNSQDIGNGRLVPNYPWESVFIPIAEWMGITAKDMSYIFPNHNNFNSSHIISTSSLFA